MAKVHTDFELYSRALIESKDVDPTYPVVGTIIDLYGFEPEWFVFVYVSYYNLGSAIQFCEKHPTSDKMRSWVKVPSMLESFQQIRNFGHERRGNSRIPENMYKGLKAFTDELLPLIEEWKSEVPWNNTLDSQPIFRQAIQSLPNHGGWASFKIAELFEKSLGYESLAVPDLGLDGRDPNSYDGPVGGLRWLFGRDNEYDKDWFPIWNKFGERLAEGWGVEMGKVETCLCKWHKVANGKYFIGHDIQEFIDLKPVVGKKYYKQIMSHFDERLWKNVEHLEKHLKSTYMKTGELAYSEFAQNLPKIDVLDVILDL